MKAVEFRSSDYTFLRDLIIRKKSCVFCIRIGILLIYPVSAVDDRDELDQLMRFSRTNQPPVKVCPGSLRGMVIFVQGNGVVY